MNIKTAFSNLSRTQEIPLHPQLTPLVHRAGLQSWWSLQPLGKGISGLRESTPPFVHTALLFLEGPL